MTLLAGCGGEVDTELGGHFGAGDYLEGGAGGVLEDDGVGPGAVEIDGEAAAALGDADGAGMGGGILGYGFFDTADGEMPFLDLLGNEGLEGGGEMDAVEAAVDVGSEAHPYAVEGEVEGLAMEAEMGLHHGEDGHLALAQGRFEGLGRILRGARAGVAYAVDVVVDNVVESSAFGNEGAVGFDSCHG